MVVAGIYHNTLSMVKLTFDLWCHIKVSNNLFICDQDLSEYFSLSSIRLGFHSKPGLKKCRKSLKHKTPSSIQTRHNIKKMHFPKKRAIIFQDSYHAGIVLRRTMMLVFNIFLHSNWDYTVVGRFRENFNIIPRVFTLQPMSPRIIFVWGSLL